MKRLCFAVAAVLTLAAGRPAHAASFQYNLDFPINGTPSLGTAVATVEDFGTDTVRITMDLTGFQGQTGDNLQYVPVWLFNYEPGATGPALSPGDFSYVQGVASTDISVGEDAFNGGNQVKAGLFDVQFEFPTPNSGRLTAGTISVYDLSATGIQASMFNHVSVPDGNVGGGYYTAIEVRAIGTGGASGSMGANTSIAVPEPSTVVMGAMASLAGLVGYVRARHRLAV